MKSHSKTGVKNDIKTEINYEITLTTWIDVAKKRLPADKQLIDDLWLIRDIIEGLSDHKRFKARLLKRVRAFDRTEITEGLTKLLEEHYAD